MHAGYSPFDLICVYMTHEIQCRQFLGLKHSIFVMDFNTWCPGKHAKKGACATTTSADNKNRAGMLVHGLPILRSIGNTCSEGHWLEGHHHLGLERFNR